MHADPYWQEPEAASSARVWQIGAVEDADAPDAGLDDRLRARSTVLSFPRPEGARPVRAASDPGRTEIVATSARMRAVLEELAQVAATDATVLILGETGTGKELVARAVHEQSPRRRGPMIAVNCAAIPANLIESELFGHERGAFTGATRRRDGRFALANGGTIFLDEIGELPLDLQAKLLRVLQEGEFEPVGSSTTQRVNARVIAATHRDLRETVAQGRFREDLYYRLHVLPLHLPALRERPEDIPLLVATFAKRFAIRMGKSVPTLSDDRLARLQAYAWPGNVRELQNVVERAVILGRNGSFEPDRYLGEATRTPAASPADADSARILTVDDLRRLERDNIVRALDICGWQIAGDRGAAWLLRMNASTLASRIKALGIRRQSSAAFMQPDAA